MEENVVMRIVLLSDAYLHDSTLNHAKMMHELAVKFVDKGHDVVVITPGLTDQDQLVEHFRLDGVEVWKFRARPTRGVSHFHRAINETLLSWFAYRAITKSKLDAKFDLVVNYSPTIFFAPIARWLRGQGAYVYLVLRDFFPQWIVDDGLIKSGSIVERYFKFVEHLNYSTADVIAVQSPANLSVFDQMVHPRSFPTDVLFNWAAPLPEIDEAFGRSFIDHHELKEKFIFFYGGNIGHAQDIPCILRLAASFEANKKIHFLIVGQGDQYRNVGRKIQEMRLTNTTLAPSVSQDEYRSILTKVDAGIFTLSCSHKGHNFPGKILGYLAQGLPVLGAVNSGNDLIETVNESGAGLVTINGDLERFVQNALLIYQDAAARKGMRESAKKLLSSRFSVDAAAERILDRYAQEK